jgi:hypothetical protein
MKDIINQNLPNCSGERIQIYKVFYYATNKLYLGLDKASQLYLNASRQ